MRVKVETDKQAPEHPMRRAPHPAGSAGRRSHSRGRSSKTGVNPKEKVAIIALLAAAGVLLVGVVIAACVILSKPADKGVIRNNVFAAGVNLGGMTEDEARQALIKATADTYTKLDMSIQVLDTTVTLPAKDTCAKLDVDAVVKAAMNSSGSGTISVLPHLSLNTEYIRGKVEELGSRYSSTLSQGSITVEGEKPNMIQDTYDTSIPYQTLVVYMGTAEYGLNVNDLYNQVMDAYNINLFQVVGQCSMVAPDPLDLQSYYDSICTKPVDATLDAETYEVTKEVYGYGFDLNEAAEQLASAQYGQTLRIPICFIEPDITAQMLAGDLFRDVLATFTVTDSAADKNLLTNLNLACNTINGLLIKSNGKFSFSEAIGQPSVGKGYQKVTMYQGTKLTEVLGGGISHVATALYNCALLSDLDIVERHPHTYAPGYVASGLDAQIIWASDDLIFTNNTSYPIRIEAKVVNGSVQISLIGTDDKDYYVKIETNVAEHKPSTLIQTMVQDNPGKYKENDVLVEGITGYDVTVYCSRYEKQTNRLLNSVVVSADRYEKRNKVIVAIQIPVTEPEETTPSTPTETQ